MNRRHVALLALLGVILAACSAPAARVSAPPVASASVSGRALAPATPPEAAPGMASSAAQLLAGADPSDATAVAATFARLSWTLDTTTEASEVAAEALLAPLMTPQLAARVQAGMSTHAGATFLLWSSHQATTMASLVETFDPGAPADTPLVAYRSFAITVTPHGRDGWSGPPATEVEFLTLSRPAPGLPWSIANVT